MYILAIETTGPLGSVSIADEKGNIIAYKVTTEEMSHMKNLIPMTVEALKDAGINKTDLTHIVCSVGPGSFTGLRVGVSTARALSQALKLPAVPVGTLDAFIMKPCKTRYISAILNARRGQVYGMIYDRKKEEFLLAPSACMLTDVIECIENNNILSELTYYGDGIDAYFEKKESGFAIEDVTCFAGKEERYQDASSAAKYAAKFNKKGILEVDFKDLIPNYMRPAEAERKLENGELNIKSMSVE